ncbi:hypothetical protein TgHK011_005363 [Trichoderma gracile]|nr:hypothetical protein TgHK011_005363 [Trichoderma gracile]
MTFALWSSLKKSLDIAQWGGLKATRLGKEKRAKGNDLMAGCGVTGPRLTVRLEGCSPVSLPKHATGRVPADGGATLPLVQTSLSSATPHHLQADRNRKRMCTTERPI